MISRIPYFCPGGCYNFEVPDYRTAHIYMRHWQHDDWGGAYINVWFEDLAWFVRCVNPDGSGKIYINNNDVMELACSPGDINSQ